MDNPQATYSDFKKHLSLIEQTKKDGFDKLQSEESFNAIKEHVLSIRELLKEKHGPDTIFYTEEVFLNNEAAEKILDKYDGVGGTPDMILIDGEGKIHVYDFKNKVAESAEVARRKIDKKYDGMSDLIKWSRQQSAYKDMMDATGLPVESVNAVVFPTTYIREPFKGDYTSISEINKFVPTPSFANKEQPVNEAFIAPLTYNNVLDKAAIPDDVIRLAIEPIKDSPKAFKKEEKTDETSASLDIESKKTKPSIRKFRKRGGNKNKPSEGLLAGEFTAKRDVKWDRDTELLAYNKRFRFPVIELDDLREIGESGGEGSWGLFKNALIYMTKNAPRGVLFHEAFHGVFRLMLNDEQRKAILDEAKASDKFKKPTTKDLVRIGELYPDLESSELEDAYYEEQLAEAYRQYFLTSEISGFNLPKIIRNVFKKIYLIAKELYKGNLNIDEYFFLMNQGRYKNKRLSNQVYKFASAARSVSNMTDQETSSAVRMINGLLFTVVKKELVGKKTLKEALEEQPNNKSRQILLNKMYKTVAEYIEHDLALKDEKGVLNDEAADFGTRLLDNIDSGSLVLMSLKDLSRVGIVFNSDKTIEFTNTQDSSLQNDGVLMSEDDASGGHRESYMEDQLTISPFENASGLLKERFYFGYKKKYVSNGELLTETNELGFAEYEDGFELYGFLLKNISDSFDTNEKTGVDIMMEKLKNAAKYKPSLADVYDDALNDSDFRTELYLGIGGLTKIDYLLVNQNNSDEFNVGIVNNLRADKVIFGDISQYFNTISDSAIGEMKRSIPKIDTIIGYTKEHGKISDPNRPGTEDTSYETIFNVFSNFGISITESELADLDNNARSIGKVLRSIRDVFDKFVKTVEENKNKANKDKKNPHPIQDKESAKNIREIAKTLSKFSNVITQDSIRSGDKTYYAYSKPSFLSKHISTLNNLKDDNVYSRDSFYSWSPLYKSLTEGKKGIKLKLEYAMLDRLKERGITNGKEYTDMSPAEYISTLIHSWYNNEAKSNMGWFPTSVLADGSKMMLLQLPKISVLEREDFVYGAVMQEVSRMNKENLPYKNERSKQFNLGIADSALNALLKEKGIEWFADKKNKSEIYSAVSSELDSSFDEFVDMLVESKLLNKKEKEGEETSYTIKDNRLDKRFEKNLMKNLKDFYYDSILNQSQIISLFAGDPAFYKDKKDFFKRVKQIYSPGTFLDVSAKFNGKVSEGFSDTIPETYRTIFIRDRKFEFAQKKEIKDALINSGVSEEEAERIADEYGNEDKKKFVDEADGQGYIDIVRYRDIMKGLRRWTQEHENALPNLIAGTATAKELALVMQPIKPFLFDHNNIGKDSTIVPIQNKNSEFLLLPQLAKEHPELMRILEAMGYTLEDSGIVTYDENNRLTDSVQYESTFKVGNFDGNITQDINSFIETDSDKVTVIDNSAYRLQQETPAHYEDFMSLFGTQLRKLGMGDIDVNGDYMIPGNEEPVKGIEIIEEFSALFHYDIIDSYKDLRNEFGLDDLGEDFMSIRRFLTMMRKNAVERQLDDDYVKAFSFSEARGGSRLHLSHPSIVNRVEAIINSFPKNNISKRKIKGGAFVNTTAVGLSDDLRIVWNEDKSAIDHFEALMPAWSKEFVDEDGFFNFDEVPKPLRDAFVYRIPNEGKYSTFPIRVIGFLPSQSGGAVMLPKAVTTIAGLDFDIDKMFAMFYEFKRNKKGEIEKIEMGNLPKSDYLIRNNAQARVLKQRFDEDLMKLMISKKALESSHTDTKDFFNEVKQKLYALYTSPVFNYKEKHIDKRYIPTLITTLFGEESISQIEDEIEEQEILGKYADDELRQISSALKGLESRIRRRRERLDNALSELMTNEEYESLPIEVRSTQAARNNRKMDLLFAVFRNKNTLIDQLDPGSFEMIEKIVQVVKKAVGGSELGGISNPMTLVQAHERNMTGKQLIGPFANHNSHHAQIQHSDIAFSTPLIINEQPYSRLDGIESQGLMKISKALASFLAMVVDNAKEPLASFINLSMFTADSFATLLRLGVPIETTILLMSQPVLRKYSSLYYNYGGDFKAENKAKDEMMKSLGINFSDLKSDVNFSTDNLVGRLGDEFNDNFQKELFLNYLAFREGYVNPLIGFVYAFKLDNGTGPTIADNNKKIDDIESALKSEAFTGVEEWYNSPKARSIRSLFEYGIRLSNDMITEVTQIPYNSASFKNLFFVVTNMFPKTKTISSKTYNKMYQDALDYLSTGHSFFDRTTDMNRALYTFLPKLVNKLADLVDDEGKLIKEKYKILEYLKVRNSKKTDLKAKFLPQVAFIGNTGLSKSAINTIKRSWYNMYFDNSTMYQSGDTVITVSDFAKMMVKYSFLKNGFKLGPQTFSHMIPIELYEAISDDKGVLFNDHMESVVKSSIEQTSDDSITHLGKHFMHQFIRNNFRSLEFIPIVQEINAPIPKIKATSDFTARYGSKDSNGMSQNPEFVVVVDNKNNKYLYIHDEESKSYYRQQPLGIENEAQEYSKSELNLKSAFNDEIKVAKSLSENETIVRATENEGNEVPTKIESKKEPERKAPGFEKNEEDETKGPC
jgi:hypothetical protein